MKRRQALAVVLAAVLALNCAARPAELRISPVMETHAPGTLSKVEQIGGHHATMLRLLLAIAPLPGHIPVKNGVVMYRVQYWTTNYNGAPTVASGLFAAPKDGALKGVVSYQHGTRSKREDAPSMPGPNEGVLGAAMFAGAGYLFLAPDYIGLGTSTELHPYLYTPSTANAVVDLLKAAHALCGQLGKEWPESLYLTGASQGGYATVAAHRELENLNDPRFRVVASAPIVAPCDLAHITFPFAFDHNTSYNLAYIAYAYSVIYGRPLGSVIAEPYVHRLPILFDGNHDAKAGKAALPKNTREMFTKEFLDAYDAGRPTWLLDAMDENSVFQWGPKAPMRLYFGSGDSLVSPQEAPHAVAEMTNRGGNVTAVCVGEYDHLQAGFHAMPQVRKWFDELASQQSGR